MTKVRLELALLVSACAVAVVLGGQIVVFALPFEGIGDLPSLVRLFVGVLVFGALAYVVSTRRVIQTPSSRFSFPVMGLVLVLGSSILLSSFGFVSFDAWMSWVVYGAGFFLAVGSLGRVRGPRLLFATLTAAMALVALRGIYEYLKVFEIEPTYRIFAGWNNPNALAGVLLVGLPIALALGLSSKGLQRGLSMAAAVLIMLALLLTQSKGGYLAAAVSIATLVSLCLIWRRGWFSFSALIPVAVAGLLLFSFQSRGAAADDQSGSMNRVSNAAGTQTQSVEYRKLLWQGTVSLIESNPVGYGIGSYRFQSARSGLHEQTQFAHQTYLQIAAEGGVLTLLIVLWIVGTWLKQVCSGARSLPVERRTLLAGCIAAIVGAGAHGLVESNLYFFGIGFLVFVLLGAGLQLATDGSSPESTPVKLRVTLAVVGCLFPLIALVYFARVELAKADAAGALDTLRKAAVIEQADIERADAASQKLASIARADAEAWYLRASIERRSNKERLPLLEKAVQLQPRTQYLRFLARVQAEDGQRTQAFKTIEEALEYDAKNLRTLKLKMDLHLDFDDPAAAAEIAREIIAVEQTSYLKVRSIPQLVPTQPFEARLLLADMTDDLVEEAELLRAAVEGYARYAANTVPQVKMMAQGELAFAGETLATAREKMATAREAAARLREIYEGLGDAPSLESLDELVPGLTVD
ncbi:MAG: O-antigen ligase family protein [Armatimonadetes bacterium]|nr:O-antigen ligase family protein [Armatimonadota bacterium]